MGWRLSNELSGHQFRDILVHPINSASSLALSLSPLLVGMREKSALTRHDLNTGVFSLSMGFSDSVLLNTSFACLRQVIPCIIVALEAGFWCFSTSRGREGV